MHKLINNIKKQLEKYAHHAGQYHDESCYFPISDSVVCNCNFPKNKKEVSLILTSLYSEGKKDGVSQQERYNLKEM